MAKCSGCIEMLKKCDTQLFTVIWQSIDAGSTHKMEPSMMNETLSLWNEIE